MEKKLKSSWIDWISKIKRKKLTLTLEKTLNLFESNKTIKQIAKIREFKIETIEKQIIELISMGFIFVIDVIGKDKFETIHNLINETQIYSISKLKEMLGEDYSYFEIKCVLAYISLFEVEVK